MNKAEHIKLREYARELGLNPESLVNVTDTQENISDQRFRELTNLLCLIANQISNRSYEAYKAEESLQEQLRLHKKVKEQRNSLRQLASKTC